MEIQPITTWQDGEQKIVNQFRLSISYDNLHDYANFSYDLYRFVGDNDMIDVIINGRLTIEGQDYIDWDASSDVNFWAYQWAASKLNLQIIQ